MNFGIYDIEHNAVFGIPMEDLKPLIEMFKKRLNHNSNL